MKKRQDIVMELGRAPLGPADRLRYDAGDPCVAVAEATGEERAECVRSIARKLARAGVKWDGGDILTLPEGCRRRLATFRKAELRKMFRAFDKAQGSASDRAEERLMRTFRDPLFHGDGPLFHVAGTRESEMWLGLDGGELLRWLAAAEDGTALQLGRAYTVRPRT